MISPLVRNIIKTCVLTSKFLMINCLDAWKLSLQLTAVFKFFIFYLKKKQPFNKSITIFTRTESKPNNPIITFLQTWIRWLASCLFNKFYIHEIFSVIVLSFSSKILKPHQRINFFSRSDATANTVQLSWSTTVFKAQIMRLSWKCHIYIQQLYIYGLFKTHS